MTPLTRILAAAALMYGVGAPAAYAQPEPPKGDKPAYGDRDDITLQNQRMLSVRNDTAAALTIFLQYKSYDTGVWAWLPGDPKTSTEALSFTLEAGQETLVKSKDMPITASRMRIWATGGEKQWLAYKTRDAWLVPESNEDGEHVYLADTMQTFAFKFTDAKDYVPIPGDSDDAGTIVPPSDGTLPPPLPPIPGDDPLPLPPQPLPPPIAPALRDLAVMPVKVTGLSAMIRVKNLGPVGLNLGRRLMVQRVAPGSVPVDLGHVGPLFFFSIKTFFIDGLLPGNYRAFITPGDDFPYDGNDVRLFNISPASYADLSVLSPLVVGDKVTVSVKNVGTGGSLGGAHLNIVKLAPGAIPLDLGAVGPLAVNKVHTEPAVMLAPGMYKAYLSPFDAAPYHGNDVKFFKILAGVNADLAVLPVFVSGDKAKIKVKNLGAGPSGPGRHLRLVKLAPGAIPMDVGALGILNSGDWKSFTVDALTAGNYKAYISPDDPAPHAGNDFDTFKVLVKSDLKVLNTQVVGNKATIRVKNVGTVPTGAAQHLLVKKLAPGAIPVDHGPVGVLAVDDVKPFVVLGLAPGAYKAYLSPGNLPPNDGDDYDTFMIVGVPIVDLQVLNVLVAGNKATIKVKNVGTVPTGAGQHLFVKRLVPAGVAVDHGPVGNLAVDDVKPFVVLGLAPGSYKAYLSPGNPPPHAGNDDDTFMIGAAAADLDANPPMKVLAKVKASIKNNGPGNYVPGARQWHIEKFNAGMWNPVPGGSGLIPNLNAGDTIVVQGNYTGPGMYRLRLTPADSVPGNDTATKVLP